MSHGHNKNKGFSQTSKKYEGELKEQRQRAHGSQHSTETAKTTMDEKEPKKAPGSKGSQATS